MATDIFELLQKDHREVQSMMGKIADGNGRRRELFAKFKTELIAHSKCEEREFYAALEGREEISEKIEHSYEEHAEVEEGLQELSEMADDNEEWSDKFSELRQDLEHHIKEEESELFPKARKLLGEEAEEIGRRFQDAKQQWFRTQGEASRKNEEPEYNRDVQPRNQGGNESDEDVAGLTRDELYERARKLGIDGRSKMTKSELARAVRARG
jgi:hemerythrin superfamily protein